MQPIFTCAIHQVDADMMAPSWSEKLLKGECPLCNGARLRPKLVAKPLDVETDLHGAGYCSCCGSYFEPPTAVPKRPNAVTAESSSSIARASTRSRPMGPAGSLTPAGTR